MFFSLQINFQLLLFFWLCTTLWYIQTKWVQRKTTSLRAIKFGQVSTAQEWCKHLYSNVTNIDSFWGKYFHGLKRRWVRIIRRGGQRNRIISLLRLTWMEIVNKGLLLLGLSIQHSPFSELTANRIWSSIFFLIISRSELPKSPTQSPPSPMLLIYLRKVFFTYYANSNIFIPSLTKVGVCLVIHHHGFWKRSLRWCQHSKLQLVELIH